MRSPPPMGGWSRHCSSPGDRKSVVEGRRGVAGGGRRGGHVTGVPTCALPIWRRQERFLRRQLTSLAETLDGKDREALLKDLERLEKTARRADAEEGGDALAAADGRLEQTLLEPRRSEERRGGEAGRGGGRQAGWPRDWGSDVCSSDLAPPGALSPAAAYLPG